MTTFLYVVSKWGAPTETFVRREVQAALGAGHEVLVLSLKAPMATEPVLPLWHFGRRALIFGALITIRRRPRLSAHILWRTWRSSSRRTIAAQTYGALVGLAADRTIPAANWIHAHFAWLTATAADALATVRAVPFSVMPHAFDIYEDRVIDRLLREKLRRAAFVVVESQSIARDVSQRLGREACVLRMGVPANLIVPADASRQPEPGLVVSVGTLKEKKGHDVLIRAMVELKGCPVRLVIIGEGPARPGLLWKS